MGNLSGLSPELNGDTVKPVICLDTLYPALTAAEKVVKIAAAGFSQIEFWDWRDKDLAELNAVCRQYNVKVVNFSGHRQSSLTNEAAHDALLAEIAEAVHVSQQFNFPALMLLTDALSSDGSADSSNQHIPAAEKYRNTVLALRTILDATPQDQHYLLEPLNTALDHPGYFLSDMRTAQAIVREVDSPRLKVLCDLYHLGMMGFDPVQVIDNYLPEIGHFHIADIPGRHEPGTGAMDWPAILQHIQQAGYNGTVGFEYFPQYDTDDSLATIHWLWNLLAPNLN